MAAIYVPTVLLANAFSGETGLLPLMLSVPPFLAGMAMIYFAVQAVRHGDELQRLIHLEALALGFIGLALVTFTFSVLPTGVPERVRWIDVWVLLSGAWLLGLARAHWRHR